MEYSKPGFDTEEALVQDEIALNKQIAAEGIVLLKNDEGRMPYSTDTTFSFGQPFCCQLHRRQQSRYENGL